MFTFERSIRAEVVTHRLDVAFGFLHKQQLRGFNESRHDQGIIQNRSAKINTIVALLNLPKKIVFFNRADVGENDLNAFSPETSPLSCACYPINLVCSCGSR
jgi:hypothetical protein